MARFVNVWRAPRQPDTTSCMGIPLIDIISFNVVMNTPIWIEMSENDLGIPVAAMPFLTKTQKCGDFQKKSEINLSQKPIISKLQTISEMKIFT